MLVALNDCFQVRAEILIERDGAVSLARIPEDLRDGPATALRRPQNRYGPVVLLDNPLEALPHLREHAMNIASQFG